MSTSPPIPVAPPTPTKDFYVCTECGKRQTRLVKKLQESNYILTRCDRCSQVADKYLEFEDNLKFLSVLLCQKQVFRHVHFNINYDRIRLTRQQAVHKAVLFTAFYVTLMNWNENYLLATQGLIEGPTQTALGKMFDTQAHNLKMLYTFNLQALKAVLQNLTFLLVVFLCTYTFKRF